MLDAGARLTVPASYRRSQAENERIGHLRSSRKTNVEGLEHKVFEGCKIILSANPPTFLEVPTLTLPRYGNRFDDLWKFIDPQAYDIFIQDNDNDQPVLPYSPGGNPRRARAPVF